MEPVEIIGIVLVQNEEKYIHQILLNIVHFCDRIIVADNCSKDRTAERISWFSEKISKKVEYHHINHPPESHHLIEKFAGSKKWIFAVDGDELYDPEGLNWMRKSILAGDFDHWWVIFGNVLNCIELNVVKRYARGYLAPPCRSMTKLYNFNVIESWNGPCSERLHGGSMVFKQGFSRSLRYDMYKEISWENSCLRCLHLCFLKRSKHDITQKNGTFIRKNISDKNSEKFYKKLFGKLNSLFGKVEDISEWKQEKYMRGPLVRKEIDAFLSLPNNVI